GPRGKFLSEGLSTVKWASPTTNTLCRTAPWLTKLCSTQGGPASPSPFALKISDIYRNREGNLHQRNRGRMYRHRQINNKVYRREHRHRWTRTAVVDAVKHSPHGIQTLCHPEGLSADVCGAAASFSWSLPLHNPTLRFAIWSLAAPLGFRSVTLTLTRWAFAR
ncbi:hypothetical protein JZ751_025866, partial [Albula glossodonta]